jgi:TetR/AcrR family transcriptional repressor of mexJK operon
MRIARKLRESTDPASIVAAVGRELAAGRQVADACRAVGVSVPSYYRWKAKIRPRDAGRSQADETREAILLAAKSVFLREGYGASLDSVAAAAGVARQTVYNQFGNKDRLFSDVVQAVYQRILNPILVIESGADFIETLTIYGRHFMRIAFDPDSLALLRITLGEYQKFPELARISYALRASHAIPVLTDHIADFLREHMQRGVIEEVDPLMASEAFVGSFTAHARHRALVGAGYDTPERLEAMLQMCVKVFARGLGYRGDLDVRQPTV